MLIAFNRSWLSLVGILAAELMEAYGTQTPDDEDEDTSNAYTSYQLKGYLSDLIAQNGKCCRFVNRFNHEDSSSSDEYNDIDHGDLIAQRKGDFDRVSPAKKKHIKSRRRTISPAPTSPIGSLSFAPRIKAISPAPITNNLPLAQGNKISSQNLVKSTQLFEINPKELFPSCGFNENALERTRATKITSFPKHFTHKRPSCTDPFGKGMFNITANSGKLKRILMFEANGRTQTTAVCCIALAFLDRFNQKYKLSTDFLDFFHRIYGFSYGNIPAISVKMGVALSQTSKEISALEAKPNINAYGLALLPAWIVAKGAVKSFLNSEPKEEPSEGGGASMPIAYDIPLYPKLYLSLSRMYDGKHISPSVSKKVEEYENVINLSTKEQIMGCLAKNDSMRISQNDKIGSNALKEFISTGADLLGLEVDDAFFEVADKLFGNSGEVEALPPYKDVMQYFYDKYREQRTLLISYSARTSHHRQEPALVFTPRVEGGVTHLDYCMHIPENMYDDKIVNTALFDKAIQKFKNKKLTEQSLDLLNATYKFMYDHYRKKQTIKLQREERMEESLTTISSSKA